jgi:hypothetical protein
MAHRSIEEVFKAVRPRGRRGIPEPPSIGIGVSGNNSDLTASLSQAGQQIAQLQSAYRQQASLIAANTQAIQGNTSAQGRSALSTAGGLASSLLGGGGFGLLSPLISGIASLFGGKSAPAPLPFYIPPPPIAMNAMLNSAAPNAASPGIAQASPAAAPTQVTVNVNAMDSKSFMDHSADIANAVREAMLNMHPINGVVTSL